MPGVCIGQSQSLAARSSFNMTDAAAYLANSDGAALGNVFCPRTTSVAKYLHGFRLGSTAGAGNDNCIWEIRDYDTGTPTRPLVTSGARASVAGTFGTVGTNKWLRSPDISGGAAAYTLGELYWALMGNQSDLPLTTFPQLLPYMLASQRDSGIMDPGRSTVNGYATAGTQVNGQGFIVEHVDGSLSGPPPYTTLLNTWPGGNHARDRCAWWGGPDKPVQIGGITANGLASVSQIEVHYGDALPNATPLKTWVLSNNHRAANKILFFNNPFVFYPDPRGYLIVVRVTGSTASPRTFQVEDTGYANITTIWAAALEGGKWIVGHKHAVNNTWVFGWAAGANGLPDTANIDAADATLQYYAPALCMFDWDWYAGGGDGRGLGRGMG